MILVVVVGLGFFFYILCFYFILVCFGFFLPASRQYFGVIVNIIRSFNQGHLQSFVPVRWKVSPLSCVFLVLIYTGKIKYFFIDLGAMVREEVESFWWDLKDLERRCSLLCDIMLSLGACQPKLFVTIIWALYI